MKRTNIDSDKYGSGICSFSNRELYFFESLIPREQKKILMKRKRTTKEQEYIDNLCKYVPLIKLKKGENVRHGTTIERLEERYDETEKVWWHHENFGFREFGSWARAEKNANYGPVILNYRVKKDLYLFYLDGNSKKTMYDFYEKKYFYTNEILNGKSIFVRIIDKLKYYSQSIDDMDKKFLPLFKIFYEKKVSKIKKFFSDKLFELYNDIFKNPIFFHEQLKIFKKFFYNEMEQKYKEFNSGYKKDILISKILYGFPFSYNYFPLDNNDWGENMPLICQNLGIKGYYHPFDSCEFWFNTEILNEYLEFSNFEIMFDTNYPYIERDIFNKLKKEKALSDEKKTRKNENDNYLGYNYKILKKLLKI